MTQLNEVIKELDTKLKKEGYRVNNDKDRKEVGNVLAINTPCPKCNWKVGKFRQYEKIKKTKGDEIRAYYICQNCLNTTDVNKLLEDRIRALGDIDI